MLLKMAFRNILRNQRRSLFTASMMIGGFIFISASLGLLEGSYGSLIALFTGQYTGHVQIANREYIETASFYKTIHQYQKWIGAWSKNPEIRAIAPRIYSEGLAHVGNKTFGAEVVGIEPKLEELATHYSARILSGNALQEDSGNSILLGKTIGKVLAAHIGDELVLISQGADGSIANDIFKVRGIIGTEQEGKDDYRIYMPLKTAADFFSLYEQVHEISIHLHDLKEAKIFSEHLALTGSNLLARPWQDIEADFYRTMQTDKQGNNVIMLILMLMVGIGVLNTILMSTLERTREFGVLKALGAHPRHLFFMIVLEGFFLSIICSLLGAFFSILLNYHFSQSGIKFGEPVSFAGMIVTEFRSAVTLGTILTPAVIVISTTLLASLYPGIKASKIGVAQALREY